MIKYILHINGKEEIVCSNLELIKHIFSYLLEHKDAIGIEKMEVMNTSTGGIEMYLDEDN